MLTTDAGPKKPGESDAYQQRIFTNSEYLIPKFAFRQNSPFVFNIICKFVIIWKLFMETACKKCRREGVKLVLKGDRCMSAKCAMVKRPYAPGQAGHNFQRKMSEYGKQLREKQKAKRIYDINETQFKNYVTKANTMAGNKTENLMQLLETRIDNVVLRSGFAPSHSKARQLVAHGLFLVNGKIVYTPSLQVKAGDVVEPKKKTAYAETTLNGALSWFDVDNKKMTSTIKHLPAREEIDTPINESLIIEYYSR